MAAKKQTKKKSGPRPVKHKPGRYENVLFEFPNDDMQGTVLIRDHEMVIELPEQNGLAPALVVGECEGHLYRGINEVRDEDALSISASWCDFGEAFAGIWIEEGNEMLFKFRLPR
jgi:hypothetical protein